MALRLTLLAASRSASVLDARFADSRPLDPAGWHEVRRAKPALSYLAAAELRYCSPSARCRETAVSLGLAPLAQPALRDCDMGRWNGSTLQQVTAREPRAVNAWMTDPRMTPHGGESLVAFIQRIGAWIDTRPVGDGWVVAVVEPGVLRAALCYALKAPPHSFWHIDVKPLAAATLSGRAGEWSLSLQS
ncbi:Broad specificity phosphatase PhoE [Streptomyces sp. WMMB 714]|jgi:broad specificity phosphatase PhoE|uniref:histidine phosphatase family protein n=1 Tax=Streptomyces sp. WMMB 714 TaxID=1286822 RepID=UPI0005F80E7E|nr:histidine phosphatase family protein [Streptomyces sp. WMMB 714]SCK41974.1 Broad specificity phosphatase PhoE [Streptomyces sp. WMMB 714]